LGVVLVALVGVIGAALDSSSSVNILGFCTLTCTTLLSYAQQRKNAVIAEKSSEKAVAASTAAETAASLAAREVRAVSVVAKAAATKVDEVKDTLADESAKASNKLDELVKTTVATHMLVNSRYAAELKLTMLALKKVVDLSTDTSGHTYDVAAYVEAKRLYEDHEAKQAAVDAMPSVEKPPVMPDEVPDVPSKQ
jgi:hypothetical protein